VKRVAISQHGTSVLFTSHPKDGLVVNLYIPHNRRTPLQAEEALGPISIHRDSRGVDLFQRTSASRAEKPGAYSTLAHGNMNLIVNQHFPNLIALENKR
jgi:hypothetical protein